MPRLRQIPRALAQTGQRFLDGLNAGRTPARVCIERSLHIIRAYLSSPLADDAFIQPAGPAGWEGEAAWRAALEEAVRDSVNRNVQKWMTLGINGVLVQRD